MAIYGYHRTSTKEQHLDRGLTEIRNFCESNKYQLTEIFTDQQTGKNFDRPEYQFLKKRILPEDVIIISEIDRLGRNKSDILKELHYYREKKVRVMILEIPTTLIDYARLESGIASMMMETINNMLIEMFAVLAQTELEKKVKRQREGIAEKKRRGEWDDYGRPRIMTLEKFRLAYADVENGNSTVSECKKGLGMTNSTYYRYVKMAKELSAAIRIERISR